MLLLATIPGTAYALRPDLIAEVFDVSVGRSDVEAGDVAEGCAGSTNNRLLVQYSLRSRNVGAGDLIMGAPGCPNCTSNPGAACTNSLYVCSPAHGHAHFDSFAQSELLDTSNNVVAQSRKSGFCLLDYECADPQYSCSYQGISAGCADVYERGLPCQYIDITDRNLADGQYTLRVRMDPFDVIDEENEGNNSVEVPVQIAVGASACPRTEATDTPRVIPAGGTGSSTLMVSSSGWVTRVRVQGLQVTHPTTGNLEVHLRSPSGTDVVILDNVCGASANLSLDLDDGAISAITCPATDGQAHRPSSPLGRLVGEPAAGAWTLTVEDQGTAQAGTLANWAIEVCTQPACSVYSTFSASDVPLAIPDLGSVTSTLTIPEGTGSVARVEVLGLRGLHTYVGDLEMHLRSPAGRDVTIVNRECAAHHNFALDLSSFAPSTIPCPPTDGLPHLPANAFTAFLGDAADGDWKLMVADRAADDQGTLLGWGLRICPVQVASASCPTAPTAGCMGPTRSRLVIEDDADATKRSFRWQWQGDGSNLEQFGNPTLGSGYSVCVYADDLLVQNLPIASAGTCNGRACWKRLAERGFRYRKRDGNKVGIERVNLKVGRGRGRIEVRGQGAGLITPLPFNPNATIKVQIIRSDSATCWESTLGAPAKLSTAFDFDDETP